MISPFLWQGHKQFYRHPGHHNYFLWPFHAYQWFDRLVKTCQIVSLPYLCLCTKHQELQHHLHLESPVESSIFLFITLKTRVCHLRWLIQLRNYVMCHYSCQLHCTQQPMCAILDDLTWELIQTASYSCVLHSDPRCAILDDLVAEQIWDNIWGWCNVAGEWLVGQTWVPLCPPPSMAWQTLWSCKYIVLKRDGLFLWC